MEAVRRWSVLRSIMVAAVVILASQQAVAQNKRTQNFLVHADTQELADAVAHHAEKFRHELAMYWLGKPLRPWTTPCPIEVVSGPHLAAQGATTYTRSPVGDFQMRVIGSRERILDSVLPHEVTHTVMATHFGRPLPRWADEGICTTVEHSAERNKHEVKLREYLSNRRGIPMNDLFRLTEYPSDMLPMYAQGYSVCRFLIEQSGPRQFIAFLEGYMDSSSWTANVQAHYGYDSLKQLQDRWLAWVAQGSGPVESFVSARGQASASTASSRTPRSLTRPQVSTSPAPTRPALRTGSTGTAPPDHLAGGGRLALTGPAGTSVLGSSVSGPSDASTSWYQRRIEQTALGQIASAGARQPASQASNPVAAEPTPRPLGPPSVLNSGRYSVSQPQDELSYGSAVPTGTSARSSRMYR
ncbi:hypothetical protein Enr13x_00230 [Stieleria neptunia]|uniref:Peptidase MA-like domain-containing protein n=1 Tax=Stieleria neptunia TaxID=2527979 RepID=A0A518HHB8_9BACT|nr:hypothetical protein [Stieleria neptunia]QDV40217.1 hypothetical protein Enr13x_00230 [Stieleria neptunia]